MGGATTLALMRRVRTRTAWRTVTRARGADALRYLSFAVGGFFLAVFAFLLSLAFFGSLARAAGGEAADRLLAGAFTLAALALVFTGLATALYTLYLSRDVDLLLAMPVKERTVFSYKYWETLAGNSLFFIVIGVPAFVAYGVATGASWAFYLALPVVAVLVLMVPTGVCVLLVMPLMRVIPAGRVKEIVAALGALLVAVFYVFYFRLLGPADAPAGDPTGGATGTAGQDVRAFLESPLLNVPPGSWAAGALSGAAGLEFGRLFAGLLPLVGAAVGMYLLSLWISGWAYATGRARAAEGGGRARPSGWAGRLFAPLPRDVRAVVVKDMISLPRDLRRLVNVVVPVIMGVALGFFYGSFGEGGGDTAAFLSRLTPYLTVAGFAVLASMAGPAQSVGGEGRSYWFIAAAPISAFRLLAAKWVSAVAIGAAATLLGMVAVTVVSGLWWPGILAGLVLGVVGSAVVDLYSVGVAAMYPRFDWENPNQVITAGGSFTIAACLLGLGMLALLAAGVAFLLINILPLVAAIALAAALWALAAAGVGYAVFAAGAASLGSMDWEL